MSDDDFEEQESIRAQEARDNHIGSAWTPPAEIQPKSVGFQPEDSEPEDNIKLQESRTARTLAFWLVGMLGVSFLVHEGLVILMTFYNKAEVIPTLEHTFNEWLPVLAGLVGTAVGFYLKERK